MLKSKATRKEALKAHAERFACGHQDTALRIRTVTGGSRQMVYQCLRCGQPTSNAIARAQALAMSGGIEPPPFNDELRRTWEREKEDGLKAIFNNDSADFDEAYEEYLQSPAWQEKRRLVLTRALGICEGCAVNEAKQIHHTTYEHVGDEFLFELVAVCDACHDRLHQKN